MLHLSSERQHGNYYPHSTVLVFIRYACTTVEILTKFFFINRNLSVHIFPPNNWSFQMSGDSFFTQRILNECVGKCLEKIIIIAQWMLINIQINLNVPSLNLNNGTIIHWIKSSREWLSKAQPNSLLFQEQEGEFPSHCWNTVLYTGWSWGYLQVMEYSLMWVIFKHLIPKLVVNVWKLHLYCYRYKQGPQYMGY